MAESRERIQRQAAEEQREEMDKLLRRIEADIRKSVEELSDRFAQDNSPVREMDVTDALMFLNTMFESAEGVDTRVSAADGEKQLSEARRALWDIHADLRYDGKDDDAKQLVNAFEIYEAFIIGAPPIALRPDFG